MGRFGKSPWAPRKAAGITEAACICPYDWGGWCKHIVAALVACIHEPESIQERPTLEEIISGLERDQLETIQLSVEDLTRPLSRSRLICNMKA